MKKLVKIISAVLISTAFIGSAASAATCDSIVINGTGPESTNTVTCNVQVDVNVTCVNNTYTLTDNSQAAVTGAAESEGNSTGGAAVSGNATNSNGQTVQIGSSCTSTNSSTTPSSSTIPGASTASGAGAYIPDVLPHTSNESAIFPVAIILAVVAIVVTISRMIVTIYRRHTLR